jgi:cyclic pyranopterin phosphate synthase
MTASSHFDAEGNPRMVDIGGKPISRRMARAEGSVHMKLSTRNLIESGRIPKGNVTDVARIAGIMACKSTAGLIPMCHPLAVDSVDLKIEFVTEELPGTARLRIESIVSSTGKTGVEMEALTSVAVAALTIYDMCKGVDREIEISDLRLLEKRGGRSGHFVRCVD